MNTTNTINAWIFVLIGIFMVLPLLNVALGLFGTWIIAIGFLVIGILKLVPNSK